jgi:glycosyltransferase involved in cell wall biosynthesis
VESPESWPERGAFRKKLGIVAGTKLILFLGRLSTKKSPDLLLRAFAEAQGLLADKAMRLVFAGPDEGGVKTQLDQLARHLGIMERVQFVGPVFGQEKWAAYQDADIYVLPSQNENFGNTAAEAMAAGTPVIVSETCGIAPLLANQAGLVVRHEVKALSEALQSMLGDSKLRGHLAAGCAKVTQSLGWEGPVRDMEELYGRCVSNLSARKS